MKKAFLTLAIAAAACFTVNAQKEKDWNKDRNHIEGSGNVISKDISVQSFDELEANGVFNILLTQGGKEQLKIEAEDNLMDLVEVKNEGSKLTISMKKNTSINTKKSIKVYVTFRSLKNMDFSTVGNVTAENKLSFDNISIRNKSVGSVSLNLSAKLMTLKNESVGGVKLEGKADEANIKNTGVGSIKAGDFVVQQLDIENTGVGSAEVNVQKDIKVKDSFLGRVNNKGAATIKKKVTI